MEQNSVFHERYQLERLLGRGNFSEVWLAKDNKTEVKVALKIYAPATGLDDEGLNVLAREFSLVVNVNHKNLLKPLYYDTCDRKPYLVLPYCKNGSAMKSVGKLNENDAWRFIRDVASGLSYLHDHNPTIIHQDIKPDNVMVADNGDYMITDFGVSTHVRSTLRKSMSSAFKSAGTTAYMAPERFGRDNSPIKANDIYSLGATVYEMLTGDAPFGDEGGLIQMKGAEVPRLRGDFSTNLKQAIERCLATDPWGRPTAKQLEQWAEIALQGKKINFGKNTSTVKPTSPQLKKNLLIGVGIIVVALAVVLALNLIPKGQTPKEPTLEEMAQNDFPIYKRLSITCDSLINIGDDGTVEPLLEAKKILSDLKEYETKYDTVNKEYNKSEALENALVPKLKSASKAWKSSADIQESLADKQRAEEMRKIARDLWDEENESTKEINNNYNY